MLSFPPSLYSSCSPLLLPPSAHITCSPLLLTSPAPPSCSPLPLTPSAQLFSSPLPLTSPALPPPAQLSCSPFPFCSLLVFFSLFLHSSPSLLSFLNLLYFLSCSPLSPSPSVFHFSLPHFMKYLFSIISTSLFKRKSMLESVMPLARFITGNVMCFPSFSTLPRLVTTSLWILHRILPRISFDFQRKHRNKESPKNKHDSGVLPPPVPWGRPNLTKLPQQVRHRCGTKSRTPGSS